MASGKAGKEALKRLLGGKTTPTGSHEKHQRRPTSTKKTPTRRNKSQGGGLGDPDMPDGLIFGDDISRDMVGDPGLDTSI